MGGASFVSRCNAPEVLKAAEHALDGVAVAVEERREAGLPFAIGLGRDIRQRAMVFNLTTDRVGIVAFVCMQDIAVRKTVEQGCASGAICDLAAG